VNELLRKGHPYAAAVLAFDVLALDGADLRDRAQLERRRALEGVVAKWARASSVTAHGAH